MNTSQHTDEILGCHKQQASGADGFDAVVVGAGIAGLTVARDLIASGCTVRIVEARDRVGGRLYSDQGLDLGATWFWPNEPRIQQLIAELGLETHPQHLEGDGVFHLPGGGQRLDGNPIDVPSGRFSRGAQSLAEAIADGLPKGTIQLGQAVRSIQAAADGVEVRTTNQTVNGSHVVLALPPALAVADIAFSPELPERCTQLAARTPVWMGAITKVVARYAEPFWRAAGLAGAAISHLGPMREIHDMSGPDGHPAALFGFAPSPPGEVDEATVLAQLHALFGPAAARPEAVFLHDWRTESFTSPPGVEDLTLYQLFGHPLYAEPAFEGRLHWASTETATESPGHIEGALAAGRRVSQAILSDPRRAPVVEVTGS